MRLELWFFGVRFFLDRYVILGGYRDFWVFGVIDLISGIVVL